MQITFDHVSKLYGPVVGVNDVHAQLQPGITCLFGSNGAGKSTLMKLASGQVRPTSGEVFIGDARAWSTAAKWRFGYSPDSHRFYREMSGREFVFTMTCLYGFTEGEAKQRSEQAIELVGMQDRAHRRLSGYSLGMRQRVKIAQALVHDPPVLLLDEPLGGIDPVGRQQISSLFKRLSAAGKTLLISSHLLSEVESLADSVLVMSRGRMIASGTLTELRELLSHHPYTLRIEAEPLRMLAAHLAGIEDVISVEVDGEAIAVRTWKPALVQQAVAEMALAGSLEVQSLEETDRGAEAVFRYLERPLA